MRREAVEAIIDASDESGLELRKYDNYSGRGMYGEECCAVIAISFRELIQAVAVASIRQAEEGSEVSEQFLEDLSDLRFDNMGTGIVAY